MKRFISTFVALAVLATVGQATPPDSKNIATKAKASNRPAERQTPNVPTLPAGHSDQAAERRIREALNSPTQIEFVETPLKDVIDYLKDSHHIEIQLDSPALKEAGTDESTQVTKNLRGISLRCALHLLLDELQLKYVIHNSVLLITSPAKAKSDEFLETRAYPVQDLVLPRNDGSVNMRPLKDVLTTTVAPKTWTKRGGEGNLSEIVVSTRPLLVILQTQEVHEEIENTLEKLRKAGGLKTTE